MPSVARGKACPSRCCSAGSLTSVLSNSRLAAANRPLIRAGSSVCGGSVETRGIVCRARRGPDPPCPAATRAPRHPAPPCGPAHPRAAAAGAAGSGPAWPASCAASGRAAPARSTALGRSPAPCPGRAPPAAAPHPPPP